ncbi:PD40 domain-containing protein [Microbacterium sp. 2FI]|uniref:PD40 domain-containing protein n=1 Tax=Microbacterium sp. 2FI TaxID=2502193 RepID=UPI0010F83695|nr:PD40 domain-containing protein [Microbacterium sp. 2FI]
MSRNRRGVAYVVVATSIVIASLAGTPALAIDVGADGWGPSTPVSGVNAPQADGCPIESPDGKSLYIASTRDGGDNDIWVATRESAVTSFGAPTMLPVPVNSGAQDFCPTPLPGNVLLFVSTRGGTDAYGTAACGLGDIYVTSQEPTTGEWAPPRNLGCAPDGPNGPGMEYGPSLASGPGGVSLYFSSGTPIGAGGQDIHVSRMIDDYRFTAPVPVAELNVPGADDVMPNVRPGSRELVFASSRPGSAGMDIYSSVRGPDGTWQPPVRLGPNVNTSGAESRPSLSRDGHRLYFGRDGDIYVATR